MKNIFRSIGASSVVINGRTFRGSSVSIDGDKVVVDGVTQDGKLLGDVNITINGNPGVVETIMGRIDVSGSAGSVKTMGGDVTCGDVTGSVDTMSGDVTCGDVGGSIETMSGNVRLRKQTR